MTEPNELLEIYRWLDDIIYMHDFPIIRLFFWQLKAKIDDYKKQIEDLRELSQPRPLTEKDKKRILIEFEDD